MTLQQLADFSYVTFNCLNSLVLRARAIPCQGEGSLLFHSSQAYPTGRMACRGTAVGKITFWTLQAAQENVGSPRTVLWSHTVDYFACARHSFGCHEPAEPLQLLEDRLVAQLHRLSPWPCSLQAIQCINPMGHPLRGSGRLAPWLGSRNLLNHGTWPLSEQEESSPDIFILDTCSIVGLKHWVYIWAAYANYLKGDLGGDDNGKYLAVTCGAALRIIQPVSCEVSQSGGLSWVVLGIFRKNCKT